MLVLDAISLIPLEIIRFWIPFESLEHQIAHSVPVLRINRILVYLCMYVSLQRSLNILAGKTGLALGRGLQQ